MVVAEFVGILKDSNPEAPVLLDYCGFIFEACSVEAQNGQVHTQGY